MAWRDHTAGLGDAVVGHLGEDLTGTPLVQPSAFPAAFPRSLSAPGSTTFRGVLTRPEHAARLGLADLTLGEGRLTLRASERPAGLGRGYRVATSTGEDFQVVRVDDNGEGLLEVILCRS